jgi:8-oxo-dGTP pyrophosphatase MutT (NUDIX family)
VDDATPPARGGTQFIPRPDAWRLGQPAPWRDGAMVGSVDELVERVVAREPVGAGSGFVPLFEGARHSAVLVVLHQGADGPEVLFTKRSSSLRNHRGEISFPGGRVDPGETAVQAALREAWEEVALAPELVTVHGELDHLATIVSNSHIVPVVATVAARPELQAHAAEVDRILWVSLDELARADTFREEWWGEPPADRPIFFFELSDETVWGATARILHQLLRLAHGLGGPEPLAW